MKATIRWGCWLGCLMIWASGFLILRADPTGQFVGGSVSNFIGGQTISIDISAVNTSTDAEDLAVLFTQVPSGWTLATDTFYPLPGWDFRRSDGIGSGVTNAFGPFYVTAPSAGGAGTISWELWQVSSLFGVTRFVTKLDTFLQPVTASGSPGAFALISPTPGSATEPPTPTLTWQLATNALGYRVQMEGDILGEPNPFNVIRDVPLGLTNRWTFFGEPGLSCYQKVWWRVMATNLAGSTINTGGWESFTVTAMDPFGLAALDTPGLFPQLQCDNRTVEALRDLAGTLTNGLVSFSGIPLGPTNSKVLVLIHGWNPSPLIGPAVFDLFNVTPWSSVVQSLTNSTDLTADWTMVTYNWAHDANVGTVPTAVAAGPVEGLGFIPFITSATDAAERAYQHGLVIGQKLLEQVGPDHLKQVELVGHSAGSWALYAALRYLRANGPAQLQIQVTYLDPFIPAQACLNGSHPFGPALLQSSTNYASVTVPRAVAADGYWATVDDVTDYAACGSTTIHWTWPSPQSVTFKVDMTSYGAANWYAHDGPVLFYAATIANPLHLWAGGNGWIRSMMHNEHRVLDEGTGRLSVQLDAECGCWTAAIDAEPGVYPVIVGETLQDMKESGEVTVPVSGFATVRLPAAQGAVGGFLQLGARRLAP